MGNNNFLLIEIGTAAHYGAISPAAHANPTLLGIVTAIDNHFVDEPFSSEAYIFEYDDEVT